MGIDQFREYVRLAYSNIRSNLLRTTLTCLIIAFGIMALVGIQTVISSLGNSVSDLFSSFGTNQFTITNRQSQIDTNDEQKPNPVITYNQASQFKRMVNFPSKISISARAGGNFEFRSKDEKTNPNYSIQGGDENYLPLNNQKIETGRNFSINELSTGENVGIIPKSLAKKLFKGVDIIDVLGQTITANNLRYRIIGILEDKGQNFGGSPNFMLVSIENFRMNFGTEYTNYQIKMGVSTSEAMQPAIDEATGLMRVARNLRTTQVNDFEISKPDAANKEFLAVMNGITMGGLLIGIVTLSGAAIGLMNILLVSVTERVREIGISKAIGATVQSIQIQYFTEGLLISILGGILGIFLGLIAGLLVANLTNSKFTIPWNWVGIGLLICIFVGIISSIYPAIKASRLNPIDALRQN